MSWISFWFRGMPMLTILPSEQQSYPVIWRAGDIELEYYLSRAGKIPVILLNWEGLA